MATALAGGALAAGAKPVMPSLISSIRDVTRRVRSEMSFLGASSKFTVVRMLMP